MSSTLSRRFKTPICLNVYDLTWANDYGYYLFKTGVYHSGVEIMGTEYSFGGHTEPVSGVFETEPKHTPNAKFKECIEMGETELSTREIQAIIDGLRSEFLGNSYHILNRNCNHFSNELCMALLKKPIPGWVNRLAYMGTYFNCLLPYLGIQQTPDEPLINNQSSFMPFGGSGFKLSEQTEPSNITATSTSSNSPTSNNSDDIQTRRERIVAATAKRNL